MSSPSVQYCMSEEQKRGTLAGETAHCSEKFTEPSQIRHCIEATERYYNFHQLFIEELNNTLGGASFNIEWIDGSVRVYSDYYGFGAVAQDINIGDLKSPEFDEIKPEDWMFSSSQAMSDIGVDVDQTDFKTILTDCLNRAMLKARR